MNALEKADFAKKVLVRAASSSEDRMRHGARLREEIRRRIDAGDEVSGYRVDWLDGASNRIIDELAKVALEFNERHLDDLCSLNDLGDVLATALNRLRKASNS